MRKVYELNEDWCFIKDFQEEYLKEDINLDNFKVQSFSDTLVITADISSPTL